MTPWNFKLSESQVKGKELKTYDKFKKQRRQEIEKIYLFHLNGQNYHRIGSLLPIEGEKPTFTQLYNHDTDNEIGHRIDAVIKKYKKNDVDPDIAVGLLKMLDNCNALVKAICAR